MSRLYDALKNAQSAMPAPPAAIARRSLPAIEDAPILRLSQAIDGRLADCPRRAIQIVGCGAIEDVDTLSKRLAGLSAQTLGRSVLLLSTAPPPLQRKPSHGHPAIGDIPAIASSEPLPLRRPMAAYAEANLFEQTEGGAVDPARLTGAWHRLRNEYDLVLLPTSHVGTPIGLAVAPTVDGVVLVVEAGKTRLAAAEAARDAIIASGANLLGVVLDKERTWFARRGR